MRPKHQWNLSRTAWFIAIALVGTLGFFLRYCNAHQGLPYLHYWDEPQISSTALNMLKTGDFNPHFFSYGSLPIYANYWVDVVNYLYLMGQPASATEFLSKLSDIKINVDTGYPWDISHPSFYFWNRILSAFLGSLTVIFTYLCTARIFQSKWPGLIAAVFLATLPFHIELTSTVRPDVFTTFFGILVLYYSLNYLQESRIKYFIFSLVCVGLATASKYNSVLLLIIPILTLFTHLLKGQKIQTKHVALLLIVPIITFYLLMPYALIDSVSFLNEMGGEIRHYKVLGHGGASDSIPGHPHLLHQAQLVLGNIGTLAALIIAVGTLCVYRFHKLALVVAFITSYALFMTQMKVNFHRNFLILYPFLAILFGGGIHAFYRLVNFYAEKLNLKNKKWVIGLLSIIVGAILFQSIYSSVKNAWMIRHQEESRSSIINNINALASMDTKIIIAKELRFHKQDLARLHKAYEVLSMNQILSCRYLGQKNMLLVLPKDITWDESENISYPNIKRSLEKIKPFEALNITNNFYQTPLNLSFFSKNPSILIYNTKDLQCPL